MDDKSIHEENAESQPRDDHGHFAPKLPDPTTPEKDVPAHPVFDSLIPHGVSVDHKVDDNTLLDVHLGNPLRRITQLLEDIKKQKAFQFTLKGSLGIAGIALVITTFGFFGGTKALCSKGTQSEMGMLRQLNVAEDTKPAFMQRAIVIWDAVTGKPTVTNPKNRLVLIKQDTSILHVINNKVKESALNFTAPVIITGDYDSCSQTITTKDTNSIQPL